MVSLINSGKFSTSFHSLLSSSPNNHRPLFSMSLNLYSTFSILWSLYAGFCCLFSNPSASLQIVSLAKSNLPLHLKVSVMIFFVSGSSICFFCKSVRWIFIVFYFLQIFQVCFIKQSQHGCLKIHTRFHYLKFLYWFLFLDSWCTWLFGACVLPHTLAYLLVGTY